MDACLCCVPGTFLKSPIPKSSQASYLPENHTIHDHDLAVASVWSSIVSFAVWEVTCLRAVFSASDILYVTDGLVSSVFQQCNTMPVMRVDHSSHNAHGVFCFGRCVTRGKFPMQQACKSSIAVV